MVKFTDEQNAVINKIEKWINSPIISITDLAFTIEGYAGTGKSTLAKGIVDILKAKRKIGLSAPTHTAKNNISDKVGLQAETLQKLLGLKPSADMEKYSANVKEFKPVSEPTISNYDIILIDECSMINADLLSLLMSSAHDNRTRIIFMGDPFQLPPISKQNESISKTFTLPNKGTLNTILRQDFENPNTEIISMIIDDLKRGTQNTINFLINGESRSNELGGIFFESNKEFYQNAINIFRENPSNAINNRFISFTNASVNSINDFINKKINKNKVFSEGQILFGYKTIVRDVNEVVTLAGGNGGFLVLKDTYINNSCLYTISKVEEKDIKYGSLTVPSYVVYTKEVTVPFLIPKKDTIKDYVDEVQKRVEFGERTFKWNSMYELRDLFLLNYSIPDKVKNRDLISKSIDYAYAITTHKAQGATYENSFINLPSYLTIRDITFRNKLLYVALTRTSKNNRILSI